MDSGSILSPMLLWKDFTIKYPLQESKTSEEVFDNVIYSDVYFSGREVEDGRVRIFGVFAKSRSTKRTGKSAGILILTDATETVNLELVNLYVKQGYSVLMVDYRGEAAGVDNYTHYPRSLSYANYQKAASAMDNCAVNAKKTCWYEWVAVAKYALNFLKSQRDLDTVGVLGVKAGAEIGWQLCATEEGVTCFVPLFCSGGRVFKGYYKNGEQDMPMNDDRLRFLAGLDASAYAQYLNCPTLFLTAPNSKFSDAERCLDTFSRVPKITPTYFNFSSAFTDVLDFDSKKDVDLFFAKYLLAFKIDFPKEAKLNLTVENGVATVTVEEPDFSVHKPKKVTTFIAEGVDNPSFRDWKELRIHSESEGKQNYRYKITSSASFVTAFSVITYRNGLTLSTRIAVRKFKRADSAKDNLLYSGKSVIPSVSVSSLSKKAVGGVFFNGDKPYTVKMIAGINGLYCSDGVIFNKFNSDFFRLSEYTLLKLDVFSEKYCKLNVSLIIEKKGVISEYYFDVILKPAIVWKDVLIHLSDFKSLSGRPIDDYKGIRALKIYSDVPFAVNNMIVI